MSWSDPTTSQSDPALFALMTKAYTGMGHNMPAALWPSFTAEIHALTTG